MSMTFREGRSIRRTCNGRYEYCTTKIWRTGDFRAGTVSGGVNGIDLQ